MMLNDGKKIANETESNYGYVDFLSEMKTRIFH